MKTIALIALLAALSACTNPVEDLKSPCVGGEGSPCVRHAPLEQWQG